VTAELAVARKALAAACGDVRDCYAAEGAFVAAPGSTEEAAAVMRVGGRARAGRGAPRRRVTPAVGYPAVAVRPGH